MLRHRKFTIRYTKKYPALRRGLWGLVLIDFGVVLLILGIPRGKLLHVIEEIGAVGGHRVEHCSSFRSRFPLRASLSVSLTRKGHKRKLIGKKIKPPCGGCWN